eukprot:4726079-Pyramimonas_sp.AAC.1
MQPVGLDPLTAHPVVALLGCRESGSLSPLRPGPPVGPVPRRCVGRPQVAIVAWTVGSEPPPWPSQG